MNFWAGSDGITTNLHWDELHTLLALTRGTKEGILFPPTETPSLYPITTFDRPINEIRSHVELTHPSTDRTFPLLRNAKYYRFRFQAGEALFLPSTYWHYIRSSGFNEALSFGFQGPRSAAALRRLAKATSVAVVHAAVTPLVKRLRPRLPLALRRGWFSEPTPGAPRGAA